MVNDVGIKGLGELGNVGTNAAVANAVCDATGVRLRELPIRLEKLLNAPSIVFQPTQTSDALHYSPKRVTSTAAGRWPTA